jgi:DNA-binding transcriptional ArsR family regulator
MAGPAAPPRADIAPWDLLRKVLGPGFPGDSADRMVLLSLAQHGDGGSGENARPSRERLAACTGLHKSTIRRAIRRLQEKGLVTEEARPGRVSVYAVDVAALVALQSDNRGSKGTGARKVPVPTEPTTGARKVPHRGSKGTGTGTNGAHDRAFNRPSDLASSVQGAGKRSTRAPRGRGGILAPTDED